MVELVEQIEKVPCAAPRPRRRRAGVGIRTHTHTHTLPASMEVRARARRVRALSLAHTRPHERRSLAARLPGPCAPAFARTFASRRKLSIFSFESCTFRAPCTPRLPSDPELNMRIFTTQDAEYAHIHGTRR